MMTRVLIVCLLSAILIQPVAAGTVQPEGDRMTMRPHLREGIRGGDLRDAMAFWVRTHGYLSNVAVRPIRTTLVSLRNPTGNFSPCTQKLALGADPRCVGLCDAAKESCDRQCGSVRTTCLAQCLIGFMCDYHCHAAYFVCKTNCGRAHDACVSNCPTKGGEKES